MRIQSGAVCEEIHVDGVGPVPVTYRRCDAGWEASFDLRVPEVHDLAVAHRLVAASLGEARRSVPSAVQFLLGRPVDPALLGR